jgi:hypothetical protein
MDPSLAQTIDQENSVKDLSGLQPTITGSPSDSALRVCFHSGLDGTVLLAVNCDRVREGSHVQDVVVSDARVEFRVVIDGNNPLKLSINALTVNP